MSKINSIKGNIWTNKDGATAENTFIEVVNENVKYGLPGDSQDGNSCIGANSLNSKDSNVYYGQMVNRNSVIKINAEKMRAFFYKYYTEEQLEQIPGSQYYSTLFYLKFDMFETNKASSIYQNFDYIKSIIIGYDEYRGLDYGMSSLNANIEPEIQTIEIESAYGNSTTKEILDVFPDVEIPLSMFSGELAIEEGEIYTLNMFLLGKLDGSQEAEVVDFNARPIDWIEIAQGEEA